MKIPKDLHECFTDNVVANNIDAWGENIEKLGIGCMVCILAGGLIISILGAIDVYNGFRFGLFITQYIVWIVAALIELFFYKFCANILYGLSCIVDSASVSSRVAAYEASLSEHSVNNFTFLDNEVPKTEQHANTYATHQWVCSNCGETISKYPCQHCGYDGNTNNNNN